MPLAIAFAIASGLSPDFGHWSGASITVLARSGFLDEIGEENLTGTMDEALALVAARAGNPSVHA